MPTPSTSAAVPDPTADLTIASPFKLVSLDPVLSNALTSSISNALGSMSSVIGFGVRQITRDGKPAGMVMAISFPDFPGVSSATFLDSVTTGMASSTGGKVAKKTILRVPVRVIISASGVFAAYRDGERIVIAYAGSERQAVALVTALIKANT